MISSQVGRFCCDDISCVENYEIAVNDPTQIWDCHHRAEILPCGRYRKKTLIRFGLYYKRPASELIFLKKSDHRKLHMCQAIKDKISKKLIGQIIPESVRSKISESGKRNSYWRGKSIPKDVRVKISNTLKGHKMLPQTRTAINKAVSGCHWWTDGSDNIFSRTCPGDGFEKGRTMRRII